MLHVDNIDGRIGAETLAQFRKLSEIGGPGQIDSGILVNIGRFRRIGRYNDKLFIAIVTAALGRAADAAVSRAAGS